MSNFRVVFCNAHTRCLYCHVTAVKDVLFLETITPLHRALSNDKQLNTCVCVAAAFEVSSLLWFIDHTQLDTHKHISTRTSQNDWSARRRRGYLDNKHKQRALLPSVGLEHAILATKWLQKNALECMATGIGPLEYCSTLFQLTFRHRASSI